MSKFSTSSTNLLGAAFVAFLLTSCHFEGKSITGSGKVTSSIRTTSEDFTAIEVEKGLEVWVEQNVTKSVIVEADDNLQEHIHTTVENGVLKITSDYGNYNNVSSKKVIVHMPVIKSLTTAGGSKISSGTALKSEDITLNSISGSTMQVIVEGDKVNCETSSGSHITVSGKALKLITSASSGSEIDAGDLLANDVEAETSSGSSTNVHPIESIHAKASSGGSIKYLGDPKQIDKDASSGGSISAK